MNPVILIGVGEMGGVFARGLLRTGHTVVPVTRGTDVQALASEIPAPLMVLVAVAEADLHAVLESVPPGWRERLALLQNELLPRDWKQHGLDAPTVISVWFEKKKGQDSKVLIPSPAFGPHAPLLVDALASLDIPARELTDPEALVYELVLKNVYIVTTNVCGLVTGGTVGDLWEQHQALARNIASEVIDIQEHLTGQHFDRDALIAGMVNAFEGDLEHKCMGRSAPARLQRAVALADAAGLATPGLREIQSRA